MFFLKKEPKTFYRASRQKVTQIVLCEILQSLRQTPLGVILERNNLLRPSFHSEILRGGVFLVVILERSEESREKHLARG